MLHAHPKLAPCIIKTQPDISELEQPETTNVHTHHAEVQPKLTRLQTTGGAKQIAKTRTKPQEKQKHSRHHTHTHTQEHTHLDVQEWALKAVGKLRPINVLFVVVVSVTEGGKDTLPPTGQDSSCHVQQMQPKLSERNHNSRERDCIRNGAVWAELLEQH